MVWLARPAASGAFAVTTHTGVLTVEPLCADRLTWDLPPGAVRLESALPGQQVVRTGRTTLTLLPGARARLESTAPGLVTISVSRSEVRQRACGVETRPYYEVTVGDETLAPDPVGVLYGPMRNADQVAPVPLSAYTALELRGRVTIGEAVQTGAGWNTRATGLLESGTIDLRIVPWLAKDRLTLRTEHLEPGSLFDTHACLSSTPDAAPCPAADAPPALGFLRMHADGGMAVQLYAQGAVSTQSFGGDQYVIEIPQGSAVWQSPVLKAILSVLLGIFAVYQGTRTLLRDAIGWWRGKALGVIVVIALTATAAAAEPVEVRQGTVVGAGYSFRRGASCFVVTARHVVPQAGIGATVLDRTGARADATRTYENESYDLALLALPDKSPVACSATWPDSSWLARTNLTSQSEFRAVRHYPNGRETIVRLQYAGGIRHLLTLAPVDRLTVRESDSGTLVLFDDRMAGIVQSVDSASDRVNVLRFDTIDTLIGDRSRGSSAGPVQLESVLLRGRANPTYATYVQAWLTEKAGRTVLPPGSGRSSGANAGSANACRISVDVLAWDRVSIENPDYAAVELQLRACTQRNFLSQQICQAGRSAQRTTPRRVLSQKLTINATVTPADGQPVSKLATTTHVPPSDPPLGRTELELWTLQAAVGPTLQDLMARAPCR